MGSAESGISMSIPLWWRLLRQLRLRGGGARESGAFLLGRRGDRGGTIDRIVYYDEVDALALAKGYVHLSGAAMNRAWEICSRYGVEVIADVHTHPSGPGQSSSDRAYPMVAVKGHTALIVPNFARRTFDLSGTGVYRYLGGKQWRTCPAPRAGWTHIYW
jgi:proteasome lid subunit RPN8/RPN11